MCIYYLLLNLIIKWYSSFSLVKHSLLSNLFKEISDKIMTKHKSSKSGH